jgi:hypothetical protein
LGSEYGRATIKIKPPFSYLPDTVHGIASPTTRRVDGLDFSAIGGKTQRHGSALSRCK